MKAILVVDMPHDCYDCPCYYEDRDMCEVLLKKTEVEGIIPSWCPLKPMPEKYIEREIKIETERDAEICTHGITLGRNLLIEELEK